MSTVPSKARVSAIADMMYELGMYSQAREVQALGDALYPSKEDCEHCAEERKRGCNHCCWCFKVLRT
jgi:hypothetical protein